MDSEHGPERFDTVIIGGGQSGLAAGHELVRRGVPFVILEANARIGDNWRSRWESLRLYSPARADGLPGMRFPAAKTAYPSGKQMGDYLESYAGEAGLPVIRRASTCRLRATGGRRPDGASSSRPATSVSRRPGSSSRLAHSSTRRCRISRVDFDPAIRQLHSNEYHDPSQLQDGPVLVVGASHSGADIAVEAAHAHRTLLAGHAPRPAAVPGHRGRRAQAICPVIVFLAKHVLTLRTPIGRKMAPHVRMGGGPLLRVRREDLDRAGVERFEARTESVEDGKPMLADGQVLDVANVVWCTGFRPDFRWIELPITGDDGWPEQQRGVVSSAPGLYFLGLPFLYSFASMLVAGAGGDAAYVADRVVERANLTQAAQGRGAAAATSSIA